MGIEQRARLSDALAQPRTHLLTAALTLDSPKKQTETKSKSNSGDEDTEMAPQSFARLMFVSRGF